MAGRSQKISTEARAAFAERLRGELLAAGKPVNPGKEPGAPEKSVTAAIAAVAHVSHATAACYLAGRSIPNVRALLAISDWLGVNAPWLRTGVGAKHPPSAYSLTVEEKVLIGYFRSARSRGKAAILRAARGVVSLQGTSGRETSADPVPTLTLADAIGKQKVRA
jgi:transcriptional regulator with XRE-family HTH domain